MANNNYIDDILLNHKRLANCDLSSKDYLIIMKMVKYFTICDEDEFFGGQVGPWDLDIKLQEEGLQKNMIDYTFKKLIKYNILKKNKEDLYFQLNPFYIWIPSNPDKPTDDDKLSLQNLKEIFSE